MPMRLTELAVEKLVPKEPGKRLEVVDAATPGLTLRVSGPRNKTWNVLYRVAATGGPGQRGENVRGKLQRISIGQWPVTNLKAARERAREVMEQADRGIDPAAAREEQAARRIAGSFEAVFERFVELHVKQNTKEGRFARDRAAALERAKAGQVRLPPGPNGKLGRVAAERIIAENALPVWRGRGVETITRAEVHELLDDVITKRGSAMARELRKALTSLFNWAADRGHVPASPLAGMRRPELAYTARERVLSMDELGRVWAAAGEAAYPFGHMVRLIILTGQRRSEIAEMERGWIDADQRVVEIPAARYKTKRAHVFPLSVPAWALVEALPNWNGGDCLFSTTGGKRPVSGFSKAKLRLDELIAKQGAKEELPPMEPWTVHDIRRSVATHMARTGTPQEHIERVLGHVVQGVAGTYNRYSYLDEKRAALEGWGKLWKA
ncbi:tyrosine-type recombinase/integrase [Brevundimonas sp.]|uniref:tyrosine-type recombinase/integrase n=1 Tax=Brevundimonas sp. TaxID=1871086 RepID=UPI0028AAB0F2|nr:tyrosine-type recombinase/integrase [Brevundimonas sp.]